MELEIDPENESEEDDSASAIQNAVPTIEDASVQVDEHESPPGDKTQPEREDLAGQASEDVSDKVHDSGYANLAPVVLSAGLSFVPLSIISPDSYDSALPLGRHFPWGFADPHNNSHCDFERLKDCVFSEWRGELREKSRINWYENWRSERLGGSWRERNSRRS